MRILLADDSTDHQLVIRTLIRPSGHLMDVVDNGQLAIEAFKSRRCDLVMVHAGLPVVDGLSTVRAMRAWEREMGAAAIPIVMLLRKDRDDPIASLEAGASANLERPVEAKPLYDCLSVLRWPDPALAWAGRSAEDRSKPIVVKVDPAVRELIPAFLEKRRQDLAELKAALRANDFERIRLVGHRLKGKGSGYGFAGISKAGDTLEVAARARDVFGIREGIDDLANYLQRLELVD